MALQCVDGDHICTAVCMQDLIFPLVQVTTAWLQPLARHEFLALHLGHMSTAWLQPLARHEKNTSTSDTQMLAWHEPLARHNYSALEGQ
eukprot:6648463-Lingulodinium_polyedra.AAC.1